MYTLHIANKNYSSWSLRPWVLMQELSIPFDEKLSTFAAGSNWKEFRDFCPSGLVPCLLDGQRVIWDSLAITEYLAEKHRGVWPDDTEARTWARCASAEMHSGFSALRNDCPMNCGIRVQLNKISDSLQHDISRLDELLGEGLVRFGGPFLAGDKFTAVDAFYAPVAFRVQTYGLNLSEPVSEYVKRMLLLSPMQSWQESALNEPWRDPGHEKEALESGIILKDFRKT
jgi:glutathione S-transferase